MGKLLFLASQWPEPASSAAGLRSMQLLELFLELGWTITLMTASEKRRFSAILPGSIQTAALELNSSKMDRVFESIDPDLVCFDRFTTEEQYGWRIEKTCPRAKRILDTVDLHSLRHIRQKAEKEKRKRELSDWFSELPLRELAAIYRSDLTLLISEVERTILESELNIPTTLFHVLPLLVDSEDCSLHPELPSFEQRKDFITIGNYRHPPNADSVVALATEIWPLLKKICPDANLHVYGADLTPALRSVHQPDQGLHIHGRAEHAQKVLANAKICLAPLRFGAGLKGKLLDAMLAGTPSVTTKIGAEGMQGDFLWPGAIEQEFTRFAQSAGELYHQKELWTEAQKKIPPLLKGRFAYAQHQTQFTQRIENLINTSKNASPAQLTGALLRHHQHRSTEFMSRWIEEKNKNYPSS